MTHTQAAPPRTSRWRFSLRELLLLMTALAAILALAIQNWPESNKRWESAFARNIDLMRLSQETITELGAKRAYPNNGGGSSSQGPSDGVSQMTFRAEFEATGVGKRQFADELFQKIDKQLKSSGAQLVGPGMRGTGTLEESLTLAYRSGNIRGAFHLAVEKREPDSLFINGYVCEFADRQ